MNHKTMAIIAAGTVVTVGSVVRSIKTSPEPKKREKIDAQTEAEIAAIREAKRRTMERINSGHYTFANMTDVLVDFEFETIVAYNK